MKPPRRRPTDLDTTRLNWLQKHPHWVWPAHTGPSFAYLKPGLRVGWATTLRKAIDAALSAEQKEKRRG